MGIAVQRIDHLVLNVTDADATARWYVDVLGMRREDIDGRTVLWFGDHKFHVRPLDAGERWFTARYPTAGSEDLCFSADATVDEIVGHVTKLGIAIEVGPAPREGARGPMTSVYCRDPDGNLIEISSYC
jgi:catechol 2,3-dioxygenase-like lactoylglutathione lyase family enzyme